MSYKLDKIDRTLLFELQKNARITDTALAKLLKKSKEAIRYRIKKLQRDEIINCFSIWIDLTKLGLISGKIYLLLKNNPEKKLELVNKIKQDSRVFWLGLAEGAWNLGITYFVKSNAEFYELKNRLFAEYDDMIIESHTASIVDISIYDWSFLSDKPSEENFLFKEPENYILDDIELKIINEFFQNSRINVVDIARKHNTTIDIIRNRIKKLNKLKIISRYYAKINFEKLGYEFFKTFLHLKSLSENEEKRLKEYCRGNNQIIHLVRQISPWDIELEIICKNYLEYTNLISNLTKEFSEIIRKIDTAIMNEDYTFPAGKIKIYS